MTSGNRVNVPRVQMWLPPLSPGGDREGRAERKRPGKGACGWSAATTTVNTATRRTPAPGADDNSNSSIDRDGCDVGPAGYIANHAQGAAGAAAPRRRT